MAYLTSWHNSIFGFKLRTEEHLRLEILKKLRTASLNSEFIGSYKKWYIAATLASSTLIKKF